MEGSKKATKKYSSGPVSDHIWQTKDGHTGRWRGSPWHPDQVPVGPKLQHGSRIGASVDKRSRGVFFGTPGMPRCTYASTKVGSSLGPPIGIPKAYPKRVSEAFPRECGTHMDDTPAAFVLEGVLGFNPNTAREIRRLREQLSLCEADYKSAGRGLHRELDRSSFRVLIIHQHRPPSLPSLSSLLLPLSFPVALLLMCAPLWRSLQCVGDQYGIVLSKFISFAPKKISVC